MEEQLEQLRQVEAFFSRRPQIIPTFERVRAAIEALGPCTMEVQKSQISFGNRSKFAFAWIPRAWSDRRPEKCMALSLGLARRLTDPRVVEVANPYPGRYTNHLLIAHPEECDRQLQEWLAEAYAFGMVRRGRGTMPPATQE